MLRNEKNARYSLQKTLERWSEEAITATGEGHLPLHAGDGVSHDLALECGICVLFDVNIFERAAYSGLFLCKIDME